MSLLLSAEPLKIKTRDRHFCPWLKYVAYHLRQIELGRAMAATISIEEMTPRREAFRVLLVDDDDAMAVVLDHQIGGFLQTGVDIGGRSLRLIN